MLAIQNLLRNIGGFFKNTSKKARQNCAILVSSISVFLLVSSNGQGERAVQSHGGAVECGSMLEEEGGLGLELAETDLADKVRLENQKKEPASSLEGMEGDFASSCRQILEQRQGSAQEAKREQEMEAVAVCAKVEPMHNELRQEPVNPYGEIAITEQDYEALLRIVEAEAGGEDPQGRTLVAEVILNRVLAEQFASTVYDVVFERTGGSPQFAPTADGRYYTVEVMPETVKAVEKALHEEDLSQGALFFSARSKAEKNDMAWFDRNLKWLFQYGGHEFYTLP